MNKFLRILFITGIIAMGTASILQIFFPNYMGKNSEYGTAIGWQREIGFWNLAILPILIGINLKYDYFFLKIILFSLMIGGIGFGTNHLIGFIKEPDKLTSLIGAMENYLLGICWIIGWQIEKKCYQRKDYR